MYEIPELLSFAENSLTGLDPLITSLKQKVQASAAFRPSNQKYCCTVSSD